MSKYYPVNTIMESVIWGEIWKGKEVTTQKLLKDKQKWKPQSNSEEDQTKTKLKANVENN